MSNNADGLGKKRPGLFPGPIPLMRISNAISNTNQLGANDNHDHSGLREFDDLLDVVPKDLLGAAESDVPDRVVEASSSSRIQDSPEVYPDFASRPLVIASKEQRNGEPLNSPTTSDSQSGGEDEGESFQFKSAKKELQLLVQGTAVVSTLMAGIAAQLLGTVSDDNNYRDKDKGFKVAVLSCCYASLCLNLVAPISTIFLLIRLGSMSVDEMKRLSAVFNKRRWVAVPYARLKFGTMIVAVSWWFSFIFGIVFMLGTIFFYMTASKHLNSLVAYIIMAFVLVPYILISLSFLISSK